MVNDPRTELQIHPTGPRASVRIIPTVVARTTVQTVSTSVVVLTNPVLLLLISKALLARLSPFSAIERRDDGLTVRYVASTSETQNDRITAITRGRKTVASAKWQVNRRRANKPSLKDND